MNTMRTLFASTAVAVILSIAAGCATLPDASGMARHSSAHGAPRILSAKGMLPPEKSREIIRRLQERGKTTDLLRRHEAVLRLVSDFPLTNGNKVTLLTDGRSSYAAIFKAIEGAKDTVNVEMYKVEDDEMGHQFVDLLLKKRSEGVQVNFMYDSIGSLATAPSFFERLRQAGIEVVSVNGLTAADHRKMVIVDGRLVITGGINISQVYASTPFQKEKKAKPPVPWRDTDIQIEGPAVTQFQFLFLDLWLKQKGPGLSERRYFPKLKEEGNALVRAVASGPGESDRLNYISYVSAITFAEHSIHLTNAYFIPDDDILDALTDAARRGVDVKIVVPSISDSKMALYAMRYNYGELLEAGVKLYERRRSLLHAKTAVIDGVWSTVGSTNFDMLSLSRNYEVNAVVLSPEFANQMEKMFADDLAQSDQLQLKKWHKRSLLEKTRELFAHMLSHLM